jgi:hypothetical protein
VLLLWKRELKVHGGTGQSLVDLLVSVESVVDALALLLVQDDLQGLAAILALENTTTNNLNWVDKIGHDGLVNGLESARSRALLLLVRAAAVGTLRAGKDAARCNDNDMAIRELLLQLASKT